MSITQVQVAGADDFTTGSVTVTLPNPATAGNLLVWCGGGYDGLGATNKPSGFTTVVVGPGTSHALIAVKIAAGGETSVTGGGGTTFKSRSAVMFELHSTDGWASIDNTAAVNGGPTSTATTPTATPALGYPQIAIEVVGIDANSSSGVNWSSPGAFGGYLSMNSVGAGWRNLASGSAGGNTAGWVFSRDYTALSATHGVAVPVTASMSIGVMRLGS